MDNINKITSTYRLRIPKFYYLAIICTLILLNTVLPSTNVFGASPSFIRNEIKNLPHWINMIYGNQTENGPNYTKITSVTYASDGKSLNATLWLHSLKELNESHWKPNIHWISYGVMIDSDLNNNTGYDSADYQLGITWNQTSGKWIKTLAEYSSSGEYRKIVPDITNYTKFLEDGKGNYVDLNLDLSKILFPSKYRLFFYAYSQDNKTNSMQWLLDPIPWISVPQISLDVWTSPASVDLIPGGKASIELDINSTSASHSFIDLNTTATPNIIVEFQDKKLNLPTKGIAKTTLTVSSLSNIVPGTRSLDITGRVFYPPQYFNIPGSNAPIRIGSSGNAIDTSIPLRIHNVPAADISQVWNQIGSQITFAIIYIPPVVAIIGWLIPNIPRWLATRKQAVYSLECMTKINTTYDTLHQNKDECEKSFELIKREIAYKFAKGIINESNYKILAERISYYLAKLDNSRSIS
jgi:hypothetical protein